MSLLVLGVVLLAGLHLIAAVPSHNHNNDYSLNRARASHIVAVVGDRILVAGGYSDSSPEKQGQTTEWLDWSKLRDDLGLINDADESDALAASVPNTDGVMYVPALMGLGTPRWD